MLEARGLSTQVAKSTERLGEQLRRRTVKERREVAAVLDAETGARVGPIVGGTRAEVDIRPQLRAMQSGRRYLHLHTHPGSPSFTDTDAVAFVRYSFLVMAAVGTDRTWYVLSRLVGGTVPSTLAVAEAYAAEIYARAPRYRALWRGGTMTAQAAYRSLTHEVWTSVAPQLGLRYDRVEPA